MSATIVQLQRTNGALEQLLVDIEPLIDDVLQRIEHGVVLAIRKLGYDGQTFSKHVSFGAHHDSTIVTSYYTVLDIARVSQQRLGALRKRRSRAYERVVRDRLVPRWSSNDDDDIKAAIAREIAALRSLRYATRQMRYWMYVKGALHVPVVRGVNPLTEIRDVVKAATIVSRPQKEVTHTRKREAPTTMKHGQLKMIKQEPPS